MIEQLILGMAQGLAEWLPISSEAVLILLQTKLFGAVALTQMIQTALFLHLGTFLAALVYFRREIFNLLKIKSWSLEEKKLAPFLLITTVISGLLGFLLLIFLGQWEEQLLSGGRWLTLLVGMLLVGTALFQFKAKESGNRQTKDLSVFDGIFLGLTQALATLPGFSRSGLTVSALLSRKFDKAVALKLSFLMSLPIVLVGNILLNFNQFFLTPQRIFGTLVSFLTGLLTIHLFLQIAKKINFAYFVFGFGLLTIISALV
ncbi:MAG: undecaprenyl-diphosphate phosphatase [Patescibacteria group bacterium]